MATYLLDTSIFSLMVKENLRVKTHVASLSAADVLSFVLLCGVKCCMGWN